MDKIKKNKMFFIGLVMLILAGILISVSLFFYFKGQPKPGDDKTKKEDSSKVESNETTTSESGAGTAKSSDRTELTPAPTKKTMTVKVFFGSTAKDPESSECGTVYATSRTIEETVAVGRASLSELLKGVTPAEKNQGYFSAIPEGVELKSLDIKGGVAYANFNGKLVAGGSCAADRIRSQIEQTLKQYPSVKSVAIQVDGDSENALQP